MEGGRPIRELHPAFTAFNTCHPSKAKVLNCVIIHWNVRESYTNHLGAWKAPPSQKSPDAGWWCEGDAKKAKRWFNGKWCDITCPNRLCEYSLDGSGPKGQGAWCKPHSTLVAQFDWQGEFKGLPRVIFQWDSQSWNNVANLDGLFNEIVGESGTKAGRTVGLAEHLGYVAGSFPVIGLPLTMHLKERIKAQKGRRFPEVSFSTEGDRMAWMQATHALATDEKQRQLALRDAPAPLQALPPPGFTAEQMQDASEAALSPAYKPANERGQVLEGVATEVGDGGQVGAKGTSAPSATLLTDVVSPTPTETPVPSMRTIVCKFDDMRARGKTFRLHDAITDQWMATDNEKIAAYVKQSGKGTLLKVTCDGVINGEAKIEQVVIAA
ncbi:MAG: hypothetical protein A2W31_05075 [Planctomycetes bacterium RBG_16_64_10]|nr:MAG: hypothetical protein A2W31_05075 [Planctomycetes bacterium RBG_16_64_10]